MPIQLFQSAFCFKGSGGAGRSDGGKGLKIVNGKTKYKGFTFGVSKFDGTLLADTETYTKLGVKKQRKYADILKKYNETKKEPPRMSIGVPPWKK